MSEAAERARERFEAGATQESVAIAEAAAVRGDAGALALLASWRLIGTPLPRDLPLARALLRRAREAGDTWAAMAEIALTANGSGAPADWPAALRLLERAARVDTTAAEHLALIHDMRLRDDGGPREKPPGKLLCQDPRVIHYPKFLTPAECAHIALSAQDLLTPSTVADPVTGRMIEHPIRTSAAAPIGPTRESLPIQAVLGRIAAVTGIPVTHGESLTVLHYGPGQQYRMHIDALPHAANQRVATMILYLNEGYQGGETQFEALGANFVGRGGDALFFVNTMASGEPDPRSRHAGLPVLAGAKWIATRWLRARYFDVWGGG
jgi:prolyl 4-hydroxylase